MSRREDSLTTEQLMESAIKTVEQMSPEEKARVRKKMDADLQKTKAALQKVPQLASGEIVKLRQRLKLEPVATGTLQEFVEGLELSYRRLSPEQKRRWLKEVRESCARCQREWIQ